MFKETIEYLKDNPEGYWFKAKLYGWGWVPVTWQGWFVILVYLVAVVTISLPIDENTGSNDVAFVLPFLLITATMIYICYKKGEKPRWQWGPRN